MPLYVFECPGCGERIEDFFPIGCPPPVCACGEETAKVLTMPAVLIPRCHRAVNHAEHAIALEEFQRPNPNNPKGMSDEQMVKAGLATTRACSNWFGDRRKSPEECAVGVVPKPHEIAIKPETERAVAEAVRVSMRVA
ncbi:MAG: zinc ribbon domain-containing protein [Fimbriimonadaceae bacterium]|nr:zinc ribbon domain-containing protein [Fimbriimonadaceae bacterium]